MPRSEAIDYLMRCRFPLYGRIDRLRYGDDAGLAWDVRLRLLDEMDAYKEELYGLSANAITERVEENKKNEVAAAEAERPFNRPEASADYGHFACLGWLTAEEIVPLLLGKDPRHVSWQCVEPHLGNSPFAKEFFWLKERVLRSPLAQQLADRASPAQWVEWATSVGIAIPKGLSQACESYGAVVDDQVTLKRRIAELEGALAKAQKGSGQLQEEAETISHGSLQARERESLRSIIAVLSVEAGYVPNGRNTLASEISAKLHRMGIPRSDDTVRNHLRKSAEELPGKWREVLSARK